jgi:hypothetical protein
MGIGDFMKTFTVARYLGCALLFWTAAFAQSRQSQFSLTITAEQPETRIGSEARVNATLTNLSAHDVTLEFDTPLCNYGVEVRNSVGTLAADTELKKSSDCANHATGRDVIVTLRPHGSQKDTIPVSALSDMAQPGKYSVQVTWQAPKELGGIVVKSNLITVTVTH